MKHSNDLSRRFRGVPKTLLPRKAVSVLAALSIGTVASTSAGRVGEAPGAGRGAITGDAASGTGGVRVVLVGDSTVADYPGDNPMRGWGQMLPELFGEGVTVINRAASGRSTKTFLSERLWEGALGECRTGDFVLVQFGHNDSHPSQNPESTDARTDYPAFLRRYADEARAKGVKLVFVTPPHRRLFDPGGRVTGELQPYADAMKAVAAEKGVSCVDLHALSGEALQERGDAGSADLFCSASDRTHFSEKGARLMARLVAGALGRAAPALAARLRSTAAAGATIQPPAQPTERSQEGVKTHELEGVTVRVSDPVVVVLSEVGETRWGYHQFPTLSRLPDGRMLVTFNDRPDRDDAYGTPGPAYVSVDEGRTWTRWDSPEPLLTVSHSVVSEVYDGEFLCVPMSPSLDIAKRKIELPPASGRMNVYGEVFLYRQSECTPDVQAYMTSLPGVRWSPETGKWEKQKIEWDTREALIRTRKNDYVIPRPHIDNRILKHNGMLLYADFHLQHLLPGGGHPQNYACWCMASDDNGRTWKRQGLIAHDPSGDLMMGEPCLLPTSDGNLACVIRCADHRQKPMRIAFSADQGRTWSGTEPLADFGVMPQALQLGNGVAVLAYGRPGVHLMFSPDGTARKWVGPLSLVAGTSRAIMENSCGYTRLLPVSDSAFLIVYSDFKHVGEDARERKAILVRKVQVDR